MRFLVLLLMVFASMTAFGTVLELTPMEPYQSGPAIREGLLNSDFRLGFEKEIGRFVSVPLHYEVADSLQTQIYTFTLKPFDPKLPSMMFFSGGPGQNSHGQGALSRALPGWNVIFFDQRGTGFSKPDTFLILKSRAYTSSETVARDADEVRKSYGIDKISVYGHSYGTVPATIYGNKFAKNTRAVVLEGVVSKGGRELWAAPFRLALLRKAWDEFSPELRAKVIEVSKNPDLPKTWFHDVARSLMYEDNFETALRTFLEQALSDDEPLIYLSRYSDQSFYYNDSFLFGAFTFGHIACRELGMTDEGSTWEFVFNDGEFTPVQNHLRAGLCGALGWMTEQTQPYNSKLYPLRVPVTYFQGHTDGATTAPGALEHFQETARGSAQLYLARRGGHSPMNRLFPESPGGERLRDAAIQVFEAGLRGQMILKNNWITFVNENTEMREWRQYIKIVPAGLLAPPLRYGRQLIPSPEPLQ